MPNLSTDWFYFYPDGWYRLNMGTLLYSGLSEDWGPPLIADCEVDYFGLEEYQRLVVTDICKKLKAIALPPAA